MRAGGEKKLPSSDRHEEAQRDLSRPFFSVDNRTFPQNDG